jgi:hypothetical protein
MYLTEISQQGLIFLGSLLKAKSAGLRPDHFGIFAGVALDGAPMVLHSREAGVVLTSLEEFSLGRMVEVVNTPGTLAHQRAVLSRAYSQVGHPYDLLRANCEHFATWAFFGASESPQLRKYVAGAFAFGLGLWWLWGPGGEAA